MQDIQLSAVGPPIDKAALADLESYVGGPICREYKEFLLARNGGVCRPDVYSTLFTSRLWGFFRLRDKGGLEEFFDDVNEYREQDLLPIAMTLGEEFVCLEIGETPRVILVSSTEPDQVCADSWATFVQSLSQPPEPPPPFLEGIAKQPWESVQQYIESGGEVVPSEGLSLFSQAIRLGNFELFEKLMDVKATWGDLDIAMEVAILNRRLAFVKQLLAMGANLALARELANGPDLQEIREYLLKSAPTIK
ncbi:SMI1/KNR4 family protein [Blastopirellula marina]|uniref:Knr4/Smi1-like domain-containing protein n=1 Tax=Blastopirellula marina TaxID=124 RepID=A0A2S8GBV4_9BACT|nr:SMI1/KNR4 family protein [Blastopirellula marina]PQO41938.1 hypothetical protein C5Y98_02560 [Blastopirellula marina]PTL46296.1 hypothetical protein C5Y97_02560 [Blastopirellula marina]